MTWRLERKDRMYLYIIRHGQSVNNAGAEVPDPHLSDLGVEQARLTGEYLADWRSGTGEWSAPRPDFIMCSAMLRAVQTAHGIAAGLDNPPIYLRHDAHECCGPEPGCMLKADVQERFPNVEIDPGMPDGPWWPDEVEDEDARFLRGRRVARWLRERFAGTDRAVVMVSHGTFSNYLTAALLGVTSPTTVKIGLSNCGITLMDITDDRTHLWFTNQTRHLAPNQVT